MRFATHDALVDVQADGVDIEVGVLRLARPDQLWIEVRIEGVRHLGRR